MKLLDGKKFLIFGISNVFSIANGIAEAMYNKGAQLAFTFQNNRVKPTVLKIAKRLNSNIVIRCDVINDKNIKKCFFKLKQFWKNFDGLIHSIAFAPNNQLSGDYLKNITRESFNIAHEISSYSFSALAKEAINMLRDNSSLVTLSYLGSKRAIPNYNVMGLAKASLEANVRYIANSVGSRNIRVNAVSAGPIKTVSSYKIKNFSKLLKHYTSYSPLYKSVTVKEIGNVVAFLCSDLSSGITGQTIYVDGGFSISCMNELNN